MSRRIAFVIATWFGCGRSSVAPGTVGSIGALPLYFLVRQGGPWAVLGVAILVAAVGTWASNMVLRETAQHDPQYVVVDEVAGVLLTLAAAPPTIGGVTMGVLLFRFFDIVKPFPIRRAEDLPRGWGIMADDLVAGSWAALAIGAAQ